MSKRRFENFSFTGMEYLYQGLKALIEQGEGVGFHNADMGHPTYRLGAEGVTIEDNDLCAESPDANELFQILSEVSTRLKEEGIEELHYIWWYDFTSWEKFCQFALNIHKSQGGL